MIDTMLYFQRKGIGEPLVLIHGFLGTHRIFDKIMEELSLNYDVIAVDLPGHGKSQPLEANIHNVYHYAEKIIQLLHLLGVERATWIGHSFGGYITYAAVEKYRSNITKAVAVYSTPAEDDELSKVEHAKNMDVIKQIGIKAFADSRIPRYFSMDANEEDIHFAMVLGEQASEEGAIRALEAMRDRPDQTQMLDTVDIPLQIIKGTKDPWDGKFKLSNPSSYVTVAETDTSHMGMLDDPDQFLNVLQNWLKTT